MKHAQWLRRDNTRQTLLWGIALVPTVIPLWLIFHFATNVPVWDQWDPDIASIPVKAHQHQLTFGDFTAQHNEHRILIPRLIYFVIDTLSRWNTIVEMVVGWFIVLLTSLEILWLLQFTAGPSGSSERVFSKHATLLLWTLSNVVIFSSSQAQNWLWGIGLTNFTPAFFTFAAFVAAIHPRLARWPRTVMVAVFCSAATWSSGNGVVSWPLAISLFAWSRTTLELKAKLPHVAALFAAIAANLGLYFLHFNVPPHGGSDPYQGGAIRILAFFTLFIGNPFAEPIQAAPLLIPTALGITLLGLLLGSVAHFFYVWRWRNEWELSRRMLVWFCVAGYALFSAAIASKARSGFGLGQALGSRYISFSLYLSCALIPLSALVLRDLKRHQIISSRLCASLASVAVVLLLLLHVVAFPQAISMSKNWQRAMEREKGALLLFRILPQDSQLLRQFSPNPQNVVRYAAVLDDIGLIHPPMIKDANAARIESQTPFAKGTFVRALQSEPDEVTCVGWAVLPDAGKASNAVFITADNDRGEPVIVGFGGMGASWKGVIPTFDDPDLASAGWAAKIPVERLPDSVSPIRLIAWVLDPERGIACRLDGSFSVRR